MANKSNIRSIRFSDEMASIIDQQQGETFTAKLENLVTRAFLELPAKEAELERTKEEIKKKREELRKLSLEAEKYSRKFQTLQWQLRDL